MEKEILLRLHCFKGASKAQVRTVEGKTYPIERIWGAMICLIDPYSASIQQEGYFLPIAQLPAQVGNRFI
jgi:hypothetical protein